MNMFELNLLDQELSKLQRELVTVINNCSMDEQVKYSGSDGDISYEDGYSRELFETHTAFMRTKLKRNLILDKFVLKQLKYVIEIEQVDPVKYIENEIKSAELELALM